MYKTALATLGILALALVPLAQGQTLTSNSGVTNAVPKYSGPSTLTSSAITDANGVVGITEPVVVNGSVGIGTNSPGAALEVNGSVKLTTGSSGEIVFPDGSIQTTAWTSGSSAYTEGGAVNGSGSTTAGLMLNQTYENIPAVHGYKIATLAADNDDDDDHLHILVTVSQFFANTNAYIDATFSNRGGFLYQYMLRGAPVTSTADLVAYNNGVSIDIYLITSANNYTTVSYTILENQDEIVYSDPIDVGAGLVGTLVFDAASSNYPPSIYMDYSGNMVIGANMPGSKLNLNGNVAISGASNGLTFPDGTIQSTAYPGTLSGTTLPANVVSSSLNSLGTVTTGIWNATPIAPQYLELPSDVDYTDQPQIITGRKAFTSSISVFSGAMGFDNFGYVSSYRGSLNNFTNLFLGGSILDEGVGTYIVQTDGGSNYFGAIKMDDSGGNVGAINFYTGPSIGTTSYTLTTAQLANYEKMTIVGSNVGIGTAAPGTDLASLSSPPASTTPILEVNGDIALTQGLTQGKGGQVIFSDGTVQNTAYPGTLSGTTLPANVVSSSLNSLGTVTTGVWNATPIASQYLSLPSDIDYIDQPQTISGQKYFSSSVGILTNTPMGPLDVGGLYGFAVAGTNLDPHGTYSLAPLQNSGKLLEGWNRTAGGGEIDLISNRGAGGIGGFNFYDYTNSGDLNPLFSLAGSGNISIYGPIIFPDGTSQSTAYIPNSSGSLTSLGTVTTGVWNAAPIASQYLALPSDIDYIDQPQIISGQKSFTSNISVFSGSMGFDRFGYVSSYRGPLNNFTNLFLGGSIVDGGSGTYTIQTDGGSNYFGAIKMDDSGGNVGAINFYTGPSISGTSYTLTNAQLASYQKMTIVGSNVGIGTASPGTDLAGLSSPPASTTPILEVNGDIALTQGKGGQVIFSDGTVQNTAWNGTTLGGDYAESIDVMGNRAAYQPGDVIVIDDSETGKFDKSSRPYSKMVAGVFSTKPGLVGRRMTTDRPDREAEVPMAMMGIVPTKVSTENGPIERGDLLVSSGTPGYAMKGTDGSRMMGAVIGKALAPLKSGSGVIEVLISLQ